MFHDGVVGGVNLDLNDRFALDGQRLILKTGKYGFIGSTYVTENFSNLVITATGPQQQDPARVEGFIVSYPDGSIAKYASINGSSFVSTYGIEYWKNPQGLIISYSYVLADMANNILNIEFINYGTTGVNLPINQIKFSYLQRKRPEITYVGGLGSTMNVILKTIEVSGLGIGFRNYILAHDETPLGYEMLKSITEKSGDNTKSYNPTVFTYDTAVGSNADTSPYTLNYGTSINKYNTDSFTGDFDGDGKLDLVMYANKDTDVNFKKSLHVYKNMNEISTNVAIIKNLAIKFEQVFPSTLLDRINPKLVQRQGITTVEKGTSPTTVFFKNYILQGSSLIEANNSKFINFPDDKPRQYIEGDFNGDGLTDVIAVDAYIHGGKKTTFSTYFIDLDDRKFANYTNFSGEIEINQSTFVTKFLTGDFNGDGKTDLFYFSWQGLKIFTLNTSNKLSLLYESGYDQGINAAQSILMGDYNGDGKTDFMIPKNNSNYPSPIWHKYISDGVGFVVTTKEYAGLDYHINTSAYSTYDHIKYAATDYNNDGKTDIMVIKAGDTRFMGYFPNESGIYCFLNKDDTFIEQKIYTGRLQDPALTWHSIPIFLTSNHSKQSSQIAVIIGNKINRFQTVDDFSKNRLLKTITTGNGVKETITYSPLEKEACVVGCLPVYTPIEGIANYPSMDVVNAPGLRVVSMLEKNSVRVYKKQLFQYAGAVSNIEGLGFLGFRATLRTNWHNNSTPIISTVSKTDMSIRGAIVENFSVLGQSSPTKILLPADPFISKTTSVYNTMNGVYENPLLSNKVFKLKLTSSLQSNGLDGTTTETTTNYNIYNNPLTTTTIIRENGALVQTANSTIVYAPVSTVPYIIGRPLRKTTSTSVTGDVMTGTEAYTFIGTLLTEIVKNARANGIATKSITEINSYDDFGNIIQKSIAAPGVTTRISQFEYNPAPPYYGRFMTKSTDVEQFDTTYDYNASNGTIKSKTVATEINAAPPTPGSSLTTTYNTYDPWFKPTKITNYLGNSTIYTYAREGTVNTKTTISAIEGNNNDTSYEESIFDDLGRKTRTGVRDINNNMSYKDFKYDIYDRNFSSSEPHLGTPTLWTTTTYDEYSRTATITDFRDKLTTLKYEKLTHTVTDVTTGSTKTSVKNAIGKVISLKEAPEGGLIEYTYFADGNLKETDYGGNIITITQDGWGRKKSLVDPSAGTYSYTYNELGEMLTETTPNGKTTYTLDAWGKPSKKTIIGLKTNSNTIYTYDDTKSKLLIKTEFTNVLDANKKITTDYTYDTQNRLKSTEEKSDHGATFTKIFDYDDWGRVDIETSQSEIGGNKVTVKIQNEYKNGFAYKIKDLQTQKPLWETSAVNARGQLIKAKLGNDIVLTNTYINTSDGKDFGYLTSTKHTYTPTGATVMELTNDFNPKRGNLNWRTNSLFGSVKEEFKYDDLDRLTEYPNALNQKVTQTYKEDGRIDTNPVGTYIYINKEKIYRNTSIINLSHEATGHYINREGIFSDSMEDKRGWTSQDPTIFTYDTPVNNKHSGATSLKIVNAGNTPKEVFSEVWTKIDNKVATEYAYSVWVKSSNSTALPALKLEMKKANTQVQSVIKDIAFTSQLVRIEGVVTIPPDVKSLRIRLICTGNGTVWFDDVMIRETANTPLANEQIPTEVPYKDRQLTINYNSFKAPIDITEAGVDKISFVYNDNNDRSVMFYGTLGASKKELAQNRTYYSADGSMEIKQNINTGKTEFITYIGGDAYAAPVASKTTIDLSAGTSTEQKLYLHRDYQGSILAITNDVGTILEKRKFDAWGSLIQLEQNGVVTPLPAGGIGGGIVLLLDRGYTGHEHLLSVGLINMNGRLYDPKLHRFLQPDNFVQDPTSTQSFNRYGYCWNNPLKYTDPSGEIFWLVPLIYAAVNVGVDLAMNDGKMTFGQIAMSFAQGYVSGLLSNPTTLGGAFAGAVAGQLNKFMPAIPIFQSSGFNLSVSPFLGYGTSGFSGGFNFNVSGQIGDFAYSASFGIGTNDGTSSLGEPSGESNFRNFGGFVGINDGHANYGLGYSYNSFDGKSGQGVGAVTIQAGDFGLRVDEDFIGDGGDRSRTGGLLATYKVNDDLTLAYGLSMMTGEAKGKDDQTQGNPKYYPNKPKYGKLSGTRVGIHSEEINSTLRAGIMYGGVIHKGQASFYGHNSEKRLHGVQNFLHRRKPILTPYFPDRGLTSKPYSYSGSYHPNYLYY